MKLNNICALVVFYFVYSSVALAEPLTIRVLELGTGDPVQGATVVLLPSESYGTTGTKGEVLFEQEPTIENIKVLASGYETKTIKSATGQNTQEIYIEPLTLEGEELEVVAERVPDKVSKIALSAEELGHVPGSQGDPLIAIQTLSGIVVAEEGSNQVYMRGSDVNESITLVNRVPIGYLYHFGGFRSTINPLLINDLNIFLGGFPVAYGDALGGVINVGMRPPKKDRFHSYFNISTIETAALVEGPLGATGKDSYFFAARRSYFDLILSPSKLNDLANGDSNPEETDQIIKVPRYYDIQSMYRHELNNGYLDFYYMGANDAITADLREGTKTDPQIAGELDNRSSFDTVGMTWRQNLNGRWALDMPTVFYIITQRLQLGMDESGNPFFVDSELQNVTWRPQLRQHTSNWGDITYGLDATNVHAPLDLYISAPPSENDIDFILTDKEKYRIKDSINARELASYIEQRKPLTKKLTSILGLRHSRFSDGGKLDLSATSPRVTLEYQYSNATLFTATWGRYVQRPPDHLLIDGFGNPSLDYTESEHRILGVQHKISDLWSIDAEAYHKPMEKLVVDTNNPLPPNNFANRGEGEAYGLNLFLRRERRGGRMGWISYTYSKSTRYNPFRPEDGRRNFSGDIPHSLSAVWSQPFSNSGWKRWSWGLTMQVHSGAPYTPLLSVDTQETVVNNKTVTRYVPKYGVHNSEQFPTYFRLDGRIERQLLMKKSKAKVYLEIMNLLNRQNVVSYDYGENYEKLRDPDKVTGTPLYPYLGVEMEF